MQGGRNNGITEAEQISEMQDTMMEITETERNKERIIKTIEESFRDLQDNIKHNNIQIIGVTVIVETLTPYPHEWTDNPDRKLIRKYKT